MSVNQWTIADLPGVDQLEVSVAKNRSPQSYYILQPVMGCPHVLDRTTSAERLTEAAEWIARAWEDQYRDHRNAWAWESDMREDIHTMLVDLVNDVTQSDEAD